MLALLGNPDSAIQTRLGIGAILENYAGTATLRGLLMPLAPRHGDHRLRTDACHYLGLTHAEQARPYLSACLQDTNAEVRETAADSLALLDEQAP